MRYQTILTKKDLLADVGATGEFDENTLQAVKRDLRQVAQALVENEQDILLKRGDQNGRGREYQDKLVKAGFFAAEYSRPNGVYGPYTELATLGLQDLLSEQEKLKADQVHGIYTKAAAKALD